MHQIFAGIALTGCIATFTYQAVAADGSLRACSVLTQELALKASTEDGKQLLANAKVQENAMTANSCQRGRVSLMLDPFANPQKFRSSLGNRWQPLSGIGDAAYVTSNSTFSEVIVFKPRHHFHIQISLAYTDSPETVQSNAIALAKTIAAQVD